MKLCLKLAVLCTAFLALTQNASAGFERYEPVAEQVWGATLPELEHHLPVGFENLERTCAWEPGTLPKATVACAGGTMMAFEWDAWSSMPLVMRCVIYAHEAGHIFGDATGAEGDDHTQEWFLAGMTRAADLCFARFPTDGWRRARPARRPWPARWRTRRHAHRTWTLRLRRHVETGDRLG